MNRLAWHPSGPYHRRSVRRICVLLCLAVGAASALGACDAQFTPYAARVNGVDVAQSTLDAALDSVAADPGYRCLIEAESGSASAVFGAGSHTYSAAFAASSLSFLIEADAIQAAVDRRSLASGSVVGKVVMQQLGQAYTPPSGSSCRLTGATILADLAGPYLADLVRLQTDVDVLAAHDTGVSLSNAGIARYERHHRASTTLDCTWVIEVASEAKASQLAIALEGGVSFAKVARDNSLNAASAAKGGYLGCVLPASLAHPLNTTVARLPVGKLSAPIVFGKYWLLLKVTRRPAAPAAEAALAVIDAGMTAANRQLGAVVSAARVSVDPAYGTWAKVDGTWQVRPPAGPPLRLVPNPSAVGAGGSLGG